MNKQQLAGNHSALSSLSPLDGRYQSQLTGLSEIFSEFALLNYRVFVELEYLVFLSEHGFVPSVTETEKTTLRKIATDFDVIAAEKIKTWEATTKHDVKAVEYFLRDALLDLQSPLAAFAHLGLTSEDTNALSYGLMLRDGQQLVLQSLNATVQQLTELAKTHAVTPMLSRTHGQPAVPTTVGKELINFVMRLLPELKFLTSYTFEAKLTGAVGNFNAHAVVLPVADKTWPELSSEFVESLGLEPNLFTTQILPAESYTRFFGALVRVNSVLLDLNQDVWRYISDGYFIQKFAVGQVGSSTMPHKVNPIDFENSEGNLGLANALLNHFITKLPVSRLQRDLSDSTVKRSWGSALGYCLLAYASLNKGLQKISVNETKLTADLDQHWEVLAEAVQVALRAEGDAEGYEQLQKLTQGKQLTQSDYQAFVQTLKLSAAVKEKLLALTPTNYSGLAAKLTHQGITHSTKYLQSFS